MANLSPIPEESSDLRKSSDSSVLGHFERHAEIRFHPTASEEGDIHVAAEKAREAQEKFEENLRNAEHKRDEQHDENPNDCYERSEKERMTREKAKNDAHKCNQSINNQIHQKCYEAEKVVTGQLHGNGSHEFRSPFVNEIH